MNKLFPVMLTVILLGICASASADTSLLAGSAEKRIERERQLLYRTVDDLNRSQGYVQASERGLEKQIDAMNMLESAGRERDLGFFLDWYRSYAEWLGTSLSDFESLLASSYSGGQKPGLQPEPYYSLADGYARLGSQLEDQVARLEKIKDINMQRMAALRTVLDYVASTAFIEERTREKKQTEQPNDSRVERKRDRDRKDDLYERYKDATDVEILMMQQEFRNCDELQKHFVLMIETGRLELSWISRKTGDYEALAKLADVIGAGSPASLETTGSQLIKNYESDITYFKRGIEEISRARARIVPAGYLKSLDRMAEMMDTYDQMKNRYEHHIAWLSEQAGAYQADAIQFRKEK
jgi:hypothetical protein